MDHALGQTALLTTLLGPIAVLWIGALVLYLVDRFLQPQDQGIAEAAVLTLSVGSLFLARSGMEEPIRFSPTLASAPLLFADRTSLALAVLLLIGVLMASLASLGESTTGRVGRLGALGAALLYLFAGNWAMLAIAWVLVDVSTLYALAHGPKRKALGWTGVLSLCGAVALGVAVLLWQEAGGPRWVAPDLTRRLPHAFTSLVSGSMDLPRYVAALSVLAAVLRLMPFPLPTWQAATEPSPRNGDAEGDAGDDAVRERRPITRVLLFGIPALLASYLWMRLAEWDIVAQADPWLWVLPIWAGLALLAGGLKAWTTSDPDQLITSTNTYGGALVLLAAGLNLPPSWQLAVGVNALLSVSAILVGWTQAQYFRIYYLHTYWRILPIGLALVSLAGMPLTVGFPAQAGLYKGAFAAERWLSLAVTMAATAAFLGAMLRILLELERVSTDEIRAAPTEDAEPGSPDSGERHPGTPQGRVRRLDERILREIRYAAGAVLAAEIAVLGIAPGTLGLPGFGFWVRLLTVPIWAALLIPSVGAMALHRRRDTILWATEPWWPLVRRAMCLDGLYAAIDRGLGTFGSLIWGATQVVEGAGYMAWVVLACLAIVIFLLAR